MATTRSVLISGMGIAGPTLAYWLGQQGYQPTLVERAPTPRTGGYIIDFWGLGYDIAEQMGLRPDLTARGYNVEELRFVDANGRRIGGFGVDVFRSLTNGRYVSLARGDLASLIYDRIAGRYETCFDETVTGIVPSPDGAQVTFAHAPTRRFDLVVGADGLHSIVRELVFGPEERFERYLGYVVAAFEVAGYRPRDANVYVSYGEPGKQVARFAMRDDRTVFLFVWASDEPPQVAPKDLRAQKSALRAAFRGARWECPTILNALDASDDLYFDRVSQIRMDAWSRGCVALIGDAAFCPSLLAGQGSALAMISAYVLAGELAAADARPDTAFRRYEQHMRSFIVAKQNAAAGFARAFAPKTRLGLVFRNLVTRAFAIPGLATLTMGASVRDRLELPHYDTPARRAGD